jgi:Zn finger protein HypA/HybF involved in hydrogenase expression
MSKDMPHKERSEGGDLTPHAASPEASSVPQRSRNNIRDTMTLEQAQAIQAARLRGMTWEDIQVEFSIAYATIKRALKRHELWTSVQRPRYGVEVETWVRPCLMCGNTSPRRKWQFRCDACTEQSRDMRAQDFMYVGLRSHHHSGGRE